MAHGGQALPEHGSENSELSPCSGRGAAGAPPAASKLKLEEEEAALEEEEAQAGPS